MTIETPTWKLSDESTKAYTDFVSDLMRVDRIEKTPQVIFNPFHMFEGESRPWMNLIIVNFQKSGTTLIEEISHYLSVHYKKMPREEIWKNYLKFEHVEEFLGSLPRFVVEKGDLQLPKLEWIETDMEYVKPMRINHVDDLRSIICHERGYASAKLVVDRGFDEFMGSVIGDDNIYELPYREISIRVTNFVDKKSRLPLHYIPVISVEEAQAIINRL